MGVLDTNVIFFIYFGNVSYEFCCFIHNCLSFFYFQPLAFYCGVLLTNYWIINLSFGYCSVFFVHVISFWLNLHDTSANHLILGECLSLLNKYFAFVLFAYFIDLFLSIFSIFETYRNCNLTEAIGQSNKQFF